MQITFARKYHNYKVSVVAPLFQGDSSCTRRDVRFAWVFTRIILLSAILFRLWDNKMIPSRTYPRQIYPKPLGFRFQKQRKRAAGPAGDLAVGLKKVNGFIQTNVNPPKFVSLSNDICWMAREAVEPGQKFERGPLWGLSTRSRPV